MEGATTKPTGKDQAPLTLQQKFVKLREAIPAIQQKKYSDGVKYKFAKIFDVYELLTPAMNEWGINFDIVGEEATRHDSNDDPIYYHSYEQATFKGSRLVWVYEADLKIRWTNVDNPKDILEVTLHAIGTNDGGPDKAKGSAWTYCLKYYFFEKFGIDQGDDDPDMTDRTNDAYAPPRNQPAQPPHNAGGTNPPPQAQNGQTGRSGAQGGISDAQLARMYRKGEDAGYSKEQVDARIGRKYALGDPHLMMRAQYDETCAALDAAGAAAEAAAKQQGGNDNV